MSAALSLALLLALPGGGDGDLERWISELDAAREPAWTQALQHLAELGEPAAQRVLEGFSSAAFGARRSRALLLLEIPTPSCLEQVLGLLDDPDPEVRGTLTRWLGALALGESGAGARVEALEKIALRDPDQRVRGLARSALAESALTEAVPVLDRLLDVLPPGEAADAARRLAELPSARTRIVQRVVRELAGAAGPRPADEVLAALLRGYGRALAEVPLGGLALPERLPFLRCKDDPSGEVQRAGREGLGVFVARLAELSEPERAETVLEHLAQEGWEIEGCLRRRMDLALLVRGDASAALELARALERRALALEGGEAEFWELQGLFFEGASLFALRDMDGARDALARATARLEGGRAVRTDLFPHSSAKDPSPVGGALQAERLLLLALARVWQALVLLTEGRTAGDAGVLGELRSAHQLLLESRVVAMRADAEPADLDELFARDLSPHALVLFNERLWSGERERALGLARSLAEAWATVAPWEFPGFEAGPGPGRELVDPLFDPLRRGALEELRDAELERLMRRHDRLRKEAQEGPDRELQERILIQMVHEIQQSIQDERRALLRAGGVERLEREALRAILPGLARYLSPSLHALAFANELRDEGRAGEAREVAERALADLRGGAGADTSRRSMSTTNSVWNEWASAQLELLVGSAFMSEERASDAERAFLGAVRRLEALENTRAESRAGARAREAETDSSLRQVRTTRASALLSLAVNANVRMGDPARALGYFERAYELDSRPFMQVLRACYRARSGLDDEARAVLRSVVPAPSLYYNIACTYALLGETELALDNLERDFEANYPSPGALQRQREWARKDPDLRSLRETARFRRLLGE